MYSVESKAARLVIFQFLFVLAAALLPAQQPVPAVTFEQTFPGADPAHYIISIASDCHASYQSDGKLTNQASPDETFQLEFSITKSNCDKIFDLTKRVHYFEREVDSKKKNLASTGVKILSYKDSQKSTHATYNYSLIAEVQQLTTMFQSLGDTLEFGRRLEYEHHYQKLALDDELKRMEDLGRDGLVEIGTISSTLQKIVDDPSLMNMVRARAQRLLSGAK